MDHNAFWLKNAEECLTEDILNKIYSFNLQYREENASHMKRVSIYSGLFSKYLNMGAKEILAIENAAMFHDIGKLYIPQRILNKPSRLNKEEYEIMKKHTEYGYRLLRNISDSPLMLSAANIAYEHHEKYNGEGYPRGLSGDDIGFYSRIVSLSDVFDALGSDRAYRKAWSYQKIFAYIEKEKEKYFDPTLVDILLRNKDVFIGTHMKFKEKKERSK